MHWALISFALAATPAEDARFDAAAKQVAELREAYGRGLSAMLSSGDPYARMQALDALAESPAVAPEDVVPKLVAALNDTEHLPSRYCRPIPNAFTAQQGPCVELDEVANADRAKKVLLALKQRSEVADHLVRRAVNRPKDVEAIAPLIREMSPSAAAALGPRLDAHATDVVLRLALELEPGSLSDRVDAIAPLVSPERPRAAMAVLLFTHEQTEEKRALRQRAVRALQRVKDLSELRRIGPAAVPMLPHLVRQLGTDDSLTAIWTLERIGPRAAPATAALAKRLASQDDADAAAKALAAIGPGARPAKAALLAWARAADETLSPALAALVAIDAEVSADEFARLEGRFRKLCTGDTFIDDAHGTDCEGVIRGLDDLAARRSLKFSAFGR